MQAEGELILLLSLLYFQTSKSNETRDLHHQGNDDGPDLFQNDNRSPREI